MIIVSHWNEHNAHDIAIRIKILYFRCFNTFAECFASTLTCNFFSSDVLSVFNVEKGGLVL